MVQPSKSYKIHTFYRILYSCTFDVLNDTKSPLLKAFLNRELGHELAADLDAYSFSGLLEIMVERLKNAIEETDYVTVATNTRFHERYFALREIAKDKADMNEQSRVHFRINKETIHLISILKRTTRREVIELAIVLFVINCDQKTFDLIVFAFKDSEAT